MNESQIAFYPEARSLKKFIGHSVLITLCQLQKKIHVGRIYKTEEIW